MRELQVTATGIIGSRPTGPAPADGRIDAGASIGHTTFRLGTIDPPSVVLLKELLGPGVAGASLVACMLADGSRPPAGTLGLAVIVFLLSQRILSTPELRSGIGGRRELTPSFPRLLLECSCIFAVLMFLILSLHLTRFIGMGALTAWLLITPPSLMLANVTSVKLTRWWTGSRQAASRYIVIGVTEAGLELAKRVQHSSCSGRFLGFFDFREPARLPRVSPEQWAGTCGEVVNFVRERNVDAIYIALPISSSPRISALLEQLRDTTASIYLVPANIFDFDLVQPRCVDVHGIPALAVCDTPHHGLSGLRKRCLDIALALTLLVLASPVLLLIAAAVKLSSPGPVLFRQRRYGLRGEEIWVYKFRSMTVCEDGPQIAQATRDDRRTTPLGRLLRRTSLDELPQILNVLQGTMSFVGPRPHAIAHNEMYRKLISGYMIRHKVRPGITGWAQVNGLRGETDTLDKMRRRIDYDIDYLNNWSMWLDIRILLRTALLVLKDKHAY